MTTQTELPSLLPPNPPPAWAFSGTCENFSGEPVKRHEHTVNQCPRCDQLKRFPVLLVYNAGGKRNRLAVAAVEDGKAYVRLAATVVPVEWSSVQFIPAIRL